jgi:hypothetical protein
MKLKKEIAELEKKFPEVVWPKPEPVLDGSFYGFSRTMREIITGNLDDVEDVECYVDNKGKPGCVIDFRLSVYHTPNARWLTLSYKDVIDPSQPLTPQIERLQAQKRTLKETLMGRKENEV